MLSRALSLATVTLLVGCFTAGAARAAENLDAGKSPSQIFSNTCSACHKSPRGLLKTTPASSLPGFLRQHYTTGTDMASVLSSYLISNGAADPRYQGRDRQKDQSKQRDARQDERADQPDRYGRRQPPAAPAQATSRPDADGASPQGEGVRTGRDAKRYSRRHPPAEARPTDEQAPAQAATDSKSGARKKGRRGRPVVEEPPKHEQTVPADASKEDSSRDTAKPEIAKPESVKPEIASPESVKPESAGSEVGNTADPTRTNAIKDEGDKPANAAKPVGESRRDSGSDTAKVDAPRENAISEPNPLRPDPAPPAPATAAEPSSAPPPAAPQQ